MFFSGPILIINNNQTDKLYLNPIYCTLAVKIKILVSNFIIMDYKYKLLKYYTKVQS